MKRWWVIILSAVIAAVALAVYGGIGDGASGDVEFKGDGGPDTMIAYISLATAVVSLVTALVGLVMKLLDMRSSRAGGQ